MISPGTSHSEMERLAMTSSPGCCHCRPFPLPAICITACSHFKILFRHPLSVLLSSASLRALRHVFVHGASSLHSAAQSPCAKEMQGWAQSWHCLQQARGDVKDKGAGVVYKAFRAHASPERGGDALCQGWVGGSLCSWHHGS